MIRKAVIPTSQIAGIPEFSVAMSEDGASHRRLELPLISRFLWIKSLNVLVPINENE